MSYNSYYPPNNGGYNANGPPGMYAPGTGGFNVGQGPPPPIPNHSHPGQQSYPMSYPPPGGPPPNASYSMQQSSPYGAPPPPQNHPGYQPSYLPPPGPPSQQYAPPPGPPGGGYAPPPGPPQQYGSPYGGPPPQHQQYAPPYGAPQQQQQQYFYLGVPIPDPNQPEPAYAPGYDPTEDFEAVRKAMKGFGTDEVALINTLSRLSAQQVSALSVSFKSKTGKSLETNLEKETSGYFRAGLNGIALGPLGYDVELVHQAIKGMGTNELLLNEVLLGRTPSDLHLLKIGYQRRYGRDLETAVRGDLSGKTERMFTMALTPSRPPDEQPVDHNQVMRDVDALYAAGAGRIGTDEITFCDILINRSNTHLTALYDTYSRKHKSLSKVVKSEFSGHMRDGLLYILAGVKAKHAMEGPGVWRDAKMLEKAMKGLGTKDTQLVYRIVRAHWDRPRMEAIKNAYHKKYRRSLEGRVSGETSGSYKKLMVTLVTG